MQIDRIEFLKELEEEKILRESIRNVISIVKQRKKKEIQEKQEAENHIRTIVRRLIAEAKTADTDPSPGRTTGINVLEDLLKKIIPVLQDDYKILTTDEQQRSSFRAHILNGVLKALKPIAVSNEAGAEGAEAPQEDEFINIAEAIAEALDVDIGDEEKFIDIDPDEDPETEELSPQEEFGAGVEGHDLTGRNMAFTSFKKIQSNIIDAFELLENEEDENIFLDYLITNLKLYFDKFEAEIAPNLEEPTTPEYEDAAAETPDMAPEDDLGGPEDDLEGGAELGL
tara:strand:+ start:2585 stop:3436 length:852 start_codon:yes stop_codon:yes gene_type:complete